MLVLRGIVWLTAMFVGLKAQLELNPLNAVQVCVDELLSVIDTPAYPICRAYSQCLVLSHKLHEQDLSMGQIGDIEEPYQEELDRMSVGCNLSFVTVIEELRGQFTTTVPTAAPTMFTTLASMPTTTTTNTPTLTTTTPMSTVTETTTLPSSTTTKTTASTSTKSTPATTTATTTTTLTSTIITPSLTTASTTTSTFSPPTSKFTLTTSPTSTQNYIPSSTTKSSVPTTTLTSSSKTTSSSTLATPKSTTTDFTIPDCIKNTDNGCVGRPNGDYPACFPVCQKGVYISCTNGRTIIRDCQFGWYGNSRIPRFLARILYHPATKRCEYKTSFCPRDLDNQV